jgi:2-polyprenyl-6-methoxyphenol hydroxylase-like FAD-dependent oxidoreductase
LLFEKLYNTTEIQFDNEIVALDDRRDGVFVQLKKGQDRLFDLVIGADGLHSRVRSLVFGKQNKFENHLGYTVAAFEADGYRPRDENIYVMHGQPGRMVGRFALHDDKSLFLFVFSTGNEDLPTSLADQKRALREIYGKVDWECADILQALERSTELYFDSVSQIRMPRWSSGRVALVGDSAFCVSLLAGQGSALACTAAYILAGELARSECCHQEAFRRYENSLRPYIESKQRGARLFAGFFAPKTRMGLWFRNRIISGFNIPGLAKHAVGEELMDKLVLPDYSWKIAGRDLLRFRYSPPN